MCKIWPLTCLVYYRQVRKLPIWHHFDGTTSTIELNFSQWLVLIKKRTCKKSIWSRDQHVFYRPRPKALNSGLHANYVIAPIFRKSFSFIDTNNSTKFEFLERKETVVYSVEAFLRVLNFSASASQVKYLFCPWFILQKLDWNVNEKVITLLSVNLKIYQPHN